MYFLDRPKPSGDPFLDFALAERQEEWDKEDLRRRTQMKDAAKLNRTAKWSIHYFPPDPLRSKSHRLYFENLSSYGLWKVIWIGLWWCEIRIAYE